MFQKLSGKTILIFTLSCLLCLGIGTALGYGAINQDLRAAAVMINLDGSLPSRSSATPSIACASDRATRTITSPPNKYVKSRLIGFMCQHI